MLPDRKHSTTNYRALADKIEEKYVRYPHTEEDKQGLQARLSDSTLKLDDLTQQLEQFKAELKPSMDAAKNTIKLAATSLRRGYEEELQECYGIANYDTGQMEYFTADGTMIESRRLLPEEKQTFLKPL